MRNSVASRVQLLVTLWTVAHQASCPWGSPGKVTAVGCHFFLQGIFPTQGLNQSLLHLLPLVGRILLVSHLGSLNGTSALIKGPPENLALHHVGTRPEDSHHEPRSRSSPDTKFAGTLILTSGLQNCEK